MTTENIIWQHSRQLLITACCVLYLSATSQNLWNRTYIEDRPTQLFSSALSIDTTYFLLGNTNTHQTPFYETGVVAKLNANGDVLRYITNSDTLSQRTGLLYNAFLQTSKGELAFSGTGADTGQHVTFGFVNNSLDSMKLFRYKTPNMFSYQGLALVEHPLNCFYVAGIHNVKSSFNANVLLMKIDTNGSKLWEKHYDQNAYDYAKSIVVLANGNLMLGAERNDLNQSNVKTNTWLLEVDTGGNVVRQWFDPNDSTYVAEGLRQTQDGGFIYGAQKKNYQLGLSSASYNATIVKMDYNFNKQWTFIRGGNDLSIYTGITDIEELPDGNFIAAGHLTYYGTDTALNGYIVKLGAAGNLIWERAYRGIPTTQSLNFLTDIDLLPDGGLIAVGQCQNPGQTPSQVGWFLKLDSNGCEVENCLVGINDKPQATDHSDIQVYPNPASSVASILIEPDMLGADIQLFDVTGKILLSHKATGILTELNIANFSKGWYVVVVKKQGKALKSKLIIE
jgi:hypothetical protein